MSMLGIGLGGFMDGYEKAQKSRTESMRRAALDTEMKRKATLQDRADAEYERNEAQRKEIQQIGVDAKQEFDAQVAAGTQQADNFEEFWGSYALPKLKNTYLAAGDIDNAQKVGDWGETADAKQGGKLAMSALTKSQTGDPIGALEDAMAASKLNGYIKHGYEIGGYDTIHETEGGPVVGYRLNLTDADGKPITEDIKADDLPRLIATFLNPENAWKTQMEARQQAAEDTKELKIYEEKKKIDKQYGTGGDKARGDAITALRKRLDGGLAGTDTKFDDLSRDEQEKLISDEIALQQGQPGVSASNQAAPAAPSSGRKVVVDTATGKPVAQGGGKSVPAPSDSKPAPEKASTGETREERAAYMIAEADAAVKNGSRASTVAEGLLQNSIPEKDWPESLKEALKKERAQRMPGLGG